MPGKSGQAQATRVSFSCRQADCQHAHSRHRQQYFGDVYLPRLLSCHISSPCQSGLPRPQDRVGASRTSQTHLPNGSLEFLIRVSSMAIIEDYLHDDRNDTGNALGVRPGPPKSLPPSPAHTTWTGTGASLIPRITAAGGPSLSLQRISVRRLID